LSIDGQTLARFPRLSSSVRLEIILLFKVPEEKIVYSKEPENSIEYTKKLDKEYSKYAKFYDISVKLLPVWKTWIKTVVPHIEGNRVLEASFGTGYLLMQYANNYETYGIDFNTDFINTTDWNIDSLSGHIKVDGDAIPVSSGTTGGTGSAGSGNQYVELEIAGTIYKVLHDGTV
jgi:hypothetical protein